jgi:2-polyprenyl-6-methoxyphenol hydroxylase-like FAD-dependent oxidoreductase
MNPQVLIAGAGPTGLMLALWLTRSGVKVRIVDKLPEASTTSRALVVHARTLEYYHQLGFAEEAIGRGIKFAAVNLWAKGRKAGRIALGDIGGDLSPYPFILVMSQDQTERLLTEQLTQAGVRIERSTELVSFEDTGQGVKAVLRGPGGEERCESAWIAGCDGARSVVRKTLGLEFPGGTYEHLFYVADVHARGPVINGELNLALDQGDFLAAFPLPGDGNARLIGTMKREAEGRDPTWEDVSSGIIQRMKLEVERVNWFSTYHVHHRVVSHFRAGRAFVLGDAAHIHSPVGGQGMNTGLGDAVNLAWKLAMVVSGRAAESILDTFNTERVAFARLLVSSTDRAFSLVTSNGAIAKFVRLNVVPHVMPRALASKTARRWMFRRISQIMIQYHDSKLSEGQAGKVRGGDRLPWVPDNFASLASRQWQGHIYGNARSELAEVCGKVGLPLHTLPWSEASESAGLLKDALYVVRPDGYVALAHDGNDPNRLQSYLQTLGIRFT